MASRDQLDAAPGGDRDRRRRAGRDLLPPRGRAPAAAPLVGFVDGLNAILLVGAVLALVAARDLADTDPEQGFRENVTRLTGAELLNGQLR